MPWKVGPGHPLGARACYTNHLNSFVPRGTYFWRSLRPLRFNSFF